MGIESMAAVSKYFHSVAAPLLQEHRQLKTLYMELRQMWNSYGDLLRDIQQDLRLAFYIHEISIDYWSKIWQTPTGVHDDIS